MIENNRECYHCAANHPELMVSMIEYAPPGDADPVLDALMNEKRPGGGAGGNPRRGREKAAGGRKGGR